MKKLFLISLLLIVSANIHSQVLIDKPVILNGGSPADRQIENVTDSVSLNDIVPAITIQNNQGRFGIAAGSDSLSVTISSGLQFYTAGNLLYFQATAANTGPVAISINGLPFFPLKVFGNEDLKINQLLPGQVYCAIFSGTEFQLLSELNTNCRTGFVEPHPAYCMEKTERAAVNLFQAMAVCEANHSRLCKWGEWYYACQKGGLGLTGMVNNWEWTDDAASDLVRITGNGSCTALNVSSLATTTLRPYRCCYSK